MIELDCAGSLVSHDLSAVHDSYGRTRAHSTTDFEEITRDR